MTLYPLPTIELIVCFMVLLVGLYFKRSKVMFLAIILLFWQVFYIVEFSIPVVNLHIFISLFLPVAFLILAILKERAIFNRSGLVKLIVVFVILALSFALASNDKFAKSMLYDFVDLYPIAPVSDISFFIFVISFLVLCMNSFFEKRLADKILPLVLLISNLGFLFSLKPFSTPLFFALAAFVQGIALIRDAYNMAYLDTLTQIPSRRALEEYFTSLNPPFSVAMVDIDFFKKFNDTYGHDVGDEVLRFIAKELQKTSGNSRAYRYGGEEFTIVFANKTAQLALPFLEECRARINGLGFSLRKPNRPKDKKGKKARKSQNEAKKVSLSVSIGLSDSSTTILSDEIIKNADKALYKAKESGRNCVVVYKG